MFGGRAVCCIHWPNRAKHAVLPHADRGASDVLGSLLTVCSSLTAAEVLLMDSDASSNTSGTSVTCADQKYMLSQDVYGHSLGSQPCQMPSGVGGRHQKLCR